MPNLWKQFNDLLPASPRLLATVSVLHSDGSATVILISNGVLRVRSKSGVAVGDRVFVRDGEIEGSAPTLTAMTLEV
jgi:hypothetical protein